MTTGDYAHRDMVLFACPEVLMRYVKVSKDSTRAELEEAARLLRAKQKACQLQAVSEAIDEDLSELIDLWLAAG